MNALEQLKERLDDWSERLLLKGMTALDSKDETELRQCAEDAANLGMAFFSDLLEQLAREVNIFLYDPRQESSDFIRRYFYVNQYVQLAGTNGRAHEEASDDYSLPE
ncbi:hypothetical protein EBB07_02150 [Paenibacillaceae bacterium]|nr:hypothetical protein EBB07_02150 [Paenibacillaceae bacterium]